MIMTHKHQLYNYCRKDNNNDQAAQKRTCSKLILYSSGEEAAQSKSQDQQLYAISLPILFKVYKCTTSIIT